MDRVQGKLYIGPTEAGKVYLHGVGFVVLASLAVPAFGALAILLAVCIVAVTVGFILRPRVRVTGNLPDRVLAGQATHLTYTIENAGRLTAYKPFGEVYRLAEANELVVGRRCSPSEARRDGQVARRSARTPPGTRSACRISSQVFRSVYTASA